MCHDLTDYLWKQIKIYIMSVTCPAHLPGKGCIHCCYSLWPYRGLPLRARSPCDLPQRLKGALVPDVCVSWTRDIKVEVSWCLRANGSLSAAFKRDESNPPELQKVSFYQVPFTFWHKMKKANTFLALISVKWMNLEVLKMCSLCLVSLRQEHIYFANIQQFGWDYSASSWQKINWTVSQATVRPYIHQKHHN